MVRPVGAIAVLFVLMVMMIAFNAILNRLEDHLLRWRPKTTMGGEATEVHWPPGGDPRCEWGEGYPPGKDAPHASALPAGPPVSSASSPRANLRPPPWHIPCFRRVSPGSLPTT